MDVDNIANLIAISMEASQVWGPIEITTAISHVAPADGQAHAIVAQTIQPLAAQRQALPPIPGRLRSGRHCCRPIVVNLPHTCHIGPSSPANMLKCQSVTHSANVPARAPGAHGSHGRATLAPPVRGCRDFGVTTFERPKDAD